MRGDNNNRDNKQQNFEVVQFFSIKDITSMATKSDMNTYEPSKNTNTIENEDSFVSSDVSYARDTSESRESETGQDPNNYSGIIDTVANMNMSKNIPVQKIPLNPPFIFGNDSDYDCNQKALDLKYAVENVDEMGGQIYSTTENPSIEEDSYQNISGVIASRQDLLNK